MASETEDADQDENLKDKPPLESRNGQMGATRTGMDAEVSQEEEEAEDENGNDDYEDEDEDEDDEEPRLKYASMTKHLTSVYRNGDATSAFLVAGDKMVIGTHNGNIHIFSLPSLKQIKSYRAHTASISGISISPYPPPLPTADEGNVSKISLVKNSSSTTSAAGPKTGSPATRSPKPPPVPLTPSNYIHVASSSIDGNVCVASLTDAKDVSLRSFGRPVESVSLSPNFKNDHSYLSGGKSGNLILTVGGKAGTSSTSNAGAGPAATASGWLGAIGLGSSTGKDTILHSGEGAIKTVKWSLSGNFVAWVNETGIKVMRSNLNLESNRSEYAWKRLNHIDYPTREPWDEMAAVWKAQVEWIDESGLETNTISVGAGNGTTENTWSLHAGRSELQPAKAAHRRKQSEKLVVGWGDTVWICDVHPNSGVGKESFTNKPGHVDIITILYTDCIVSGVSLYTPSLLIVLAYITPKGEAQSNVGKSTLRPTETKPRIHQKQNGLQPEMRIIDITTNEEVCVADSLNISRFESLSATDYHLGTLPAMQVTTKDTGQRGTLEIIGGGIWDMGVYSTRLFSSAASVRSSGSHSRTGSSNPPSDNAVSSPAVRRDHVLHPSALAHGMKIFIHSPYDCILATKPTLADHFAWLDSHGMYEEAWNLLSSHPEAASGSSESSSESRSSTPTRELNKKHGTLDELFADDGSQITLSSQQVFYSHAEKERRRIGEHWVQQLVSAKNWSKAGSVCGKVLGTASSWEHWVWVFAQAQRFEEITPYVPSTHLRNPLPSIVYELILGHYVANDTIRLRELLEQWPPDLFDTSSVIEAILGRLKSSDFQEDSSRNSQSSQDWRILMECLGKLYVADGRPAQALGCYIRLQNAEAVMSLIGEHHLVDAVSDDIPGFILIRVSKEQQRSATLDELEIASREPIRLLVDAAHDGIVRPEAVVQQLGKRFGIPNSYLFLYLRALWNGETSSVASEPNQISRGMRKYSMMNERLAATEGKSLVSDHADTALVLFAEYDRTLLMNFLKTSQSYTLELASKICDRRNYTFELVYLLSKEGRTNQALRLIIDKIGDVSQAIAFAKEQDDPSLWDDLLDYSMDKPSFIRGLLKDVGTSIDPIKLLRRIPQGMEIQGLREGLMKMIREYELQYSISEGAARVLRSEVVAAIKERGAGQRKGIRFEIGEVRRDPLAPSLIALGRKPKVEKGRCPGCGESFIPEDPHIILSFPCRHIFHLPCLITFNDNNQDPNIPPILQNMDGFGDFDRSIGPKVDHAALVKNLVCGGCPLEIGEKG
ncbi:MAG: hypothetical protein Q9214_002575 [Letrouitia sp. 1 TL-2023]